MAPGLLLGQAEPHKHYRFTRKWSKPPGGVDVTPNTQQVVLDRRLTTLWLINLPITGTLKKNKKTFKRIPTLTLLFCMLCHHEMKQICLGCAGCIESHGIFVTTNAMSVLLFVFP